MSRASGRPGEPVQFRDDEGVAGPTGRQGKSKAVSIAVGASETVVDIDPVVRSTEGVQAVTLSGEVLLLS
jgi:hypothetical protein